MKYVITAFLSACLLSACGSHPTATDTTSTDSAAVAGDVPVVELKTPMEARIMGTYKGDFGGSPIYITINYCSGFKIAGYNTHKGLRRNLSGTITDNGSTYAITLSEPGDHEFDGVFTMKMDTSLATASGSWKPTNTKSLTTKTFVLEKLSKDFNNIPGFYSGNHCDIEFRNDGNCELNYYDKITDSTFSGQMITVKGTWEKRGQFQLFVNWAATSNYPNRSTAFVADGDTTIGEGDMAEIRGDNFVMYSSY
ncbi:hypothetical protein SAMN05428949_3597 [Chitinophaga sp. YR627]|uniref:hypothetical protein n=1 Tax=Chitinophaga sp. YR627 TaxID=1881041 RepID=UPI0008E87546|nr:hypothetical protein [Chitinophaga sp. YR627]SFN82984.1 hypothetical protein SAMN05428949_3597 [Chitinophaga sp. YR627]